MLSSEMAVNLYRSEKVSLTRAAEIAGLSLEGFKNLLQLKGIKRVVAAPPEDKMLREVDPIASYSLKYDVVISGLVYPAEIYRKFNTPFLLNVKEQGITI